MGKKNKKIQNNNFDLIDKLLDDSRITGQQIEYYNISKKSFPDTEDPIYILDNQILILDIFNKYINKIIKFIDDNNIENVDKYINNDYIKYINLMLKINN